MSYPNRYRGMLKITASMLNAAISGINPTANRMIAFSVSDGALALVERELGIDLTGTGFIWAFAYRPRFDGTTYLHAYYTGDPLRRDIVKYPPAGVDWIKKNEFSRPMPGSLPYVEKVRSSLFDAVRGNWWIITLVETPEETDVSALSMGDVV